MTDGLISCSDPPNLLPRRRLAGPLKLHGLPNISLIVLTVTLSPYLVLSPPPSRLSIHPCASRLSPLGDPRAGLTLSETDWEAKWGK